MIKEDAHGRDHQDIDLAEHERKSLGHDYLSARQDREDGDDAHESEQRHQPPEILCCLLPKRPHCLARFSIPQLPLHHLGDKVFFAEIPIPRKFPADIAVFHYQDPVAHPEHSCSSSEIIMIDLPLCLELRP